jgi:two-component system, sensor histidine kinase and response regulator
MRILVADDQKEIRQLTALQLERDGHQVVAVANGKQALEAVENATFDVLLLDEHMPEMSGIEVLHAIRAKEKGKSQIVVALTGYNTDQDRLRLVREGFDSVIGKPFRLDRLQPALLEFIASRVSPARIPPATPQTQSDASELLRSIGGDKKLLRRMIQTFLRESPKRLAQIAAAIQRNRAELLFSVAHALKGSVAIFGASQAQRYCQELQELGRANQTSEASRVFILLKEEIAKVEANLRGYAGQNSVSKPGVRPRRTRSASSPKRKPR